MTTSFERLIQRDRRLVLSGLAVVTIACWIWIIALGRDMYGSMSGAAAWMMPPAWDATHLLLLLAMWSAMMAGMMLPSAAPTLLLFVNAVRHGPDATQAATRAYAFGAGYLAVWLGFSVAASVLQRALGAWDLLSPMMETNGRVVMAVWLVVAGVYQLTPFKRTCLDACRSPAAFLMQYMQPGRAGAFRMGVRHGWSCLGCCWGLMLLLFAGGVMNLWVIAAITAFVLLEKLAPLGVQGGRLSGVLLIAAGLWAGF